MKAWKDGRIPSSNPAVIIGESGTGKTTLALLAIREVGLDPVIHNHDDELRPTFINGRTPTFFGKNRAVLLDDYAYTRGREWNEIESEVKQGSFPIIICVEHPKNVPWPIRRNAMILKLKRPTNSQLIQFLNGFPHDRSEEHIEMIASSSSSWRTALLTLLSTSESDAIVQTPRYPTRIGNAEIEAILSGDHPDHRFVNHPLAVLSAAEYNHADPSHVASATTLHSRSWETENLTPIAHAYLTTLRAKTSDAPPFRKRRIWGSIRRA